MRTILVTDDPEILDHTLRVAAAVGLDIELLPDVGAARARWGGGSLVLVGADAMASLAESPPMRRRGVLVVSVREPDAEVWRGAVALGAEHVVQLPDGDRWLASRLADADQGPARRGVVVGVRGAHGGVGASTLAVGLALAVARAGQRCLLVEADPCSGGLDLLLGIEAEAGLRWPDLLSSSGRIAPAELDAGLPHINGVSVLSWSRDPVSALPTQAVQAVLASASRGFDVTVVDLPRDPTTSPAFEAHLGATVLVVAPTVQSVAAAHRMLSTTSMLVDPVHLVARASGDDADLIAESLGRPLVATCVDDSGLRRSFADGELPTMRRGGFAHACRQLVQAITPASTAA